MYNTCPSLSNYVNTRYLFQPHFICQINPVALKIQILIGVGPRIALYIAWMHDLKLIIHQRQHNGQFRLFTSFNCFDNLPTGQIVLCYSEVECASASIFRCGTGCLKYFIALLNTRCLSHPLRNSPLTYILDA